MAVTLTSTGITFSDGSTMNAAAAGAVGSQQAFNAPGNWSRPAGVNTIVAAIGSGPGGNGGNINGWVQARGGTGGSGKHLPSFIEAVNGNLSVSVGSAGNNGTNGQYSSSPGGAGGATTVGNITANGGNAGNGAGYAPGNPGNPGNTLTTAAAVVSGGVSGYALISW
jgi:hypothetical protein